MRLFLALVLALFSSVSSAASVTAAGAPAAVGQANVTSGTITGLTTLQVDGTGPHAIGGATASLGQLNLSGTFAERRGFAVLTRLQPPANVAGLGIYFAPTIDTAATGTHAAVGTLRVDAATINAGGATVTEAYTLLINGAPTIGTTNYAFRVGSGVSKFDGVIVLGNVAEPTCNATNRGTLAMVQGGAGVADTVRICTKDAADAYAYRALF